MAGPERGRRGRDRLSHHRHHVRHRDRCRHGAAGGLARHAQLYQLDSRIIGRDEFDRLMPGANGKFKGALYTASRWPGASRRRRPRPSPSPPAGWAPRCSPTARSGRSSTRAGKVGGRGHREGPHPHAMPWSWPAAPGRACSGQSRHPAAAAHGDQLGDAHGAARRRPGNRALWMTRLRVPQAARRRLHHRQRCRQPARAVARQLPLPQGLPAGAADRVALAPAPARRPLPAGVPASRSAGARRGLTVFEDIRVNRSGTRAALARPGR